MNFDLHMDKNPVYVLIHSPLVGPLTWQLVAREMESRGLEAITPSLTDDPNSTLPFWQQHAESFAKSLVRIAINREMVLVAHSGAGPLLPILRQSVKHSIVSYVFVDAGVPLNRSSRLDLMTLNDPQWADQFHQALLRGERFPTWDDEDLREEIPDGHLRRRMVSELKPRSLSFFTEPIPVFKGWPDASCAYIQFTASYDWDCKQAEQAGWHVRKLHAGHFHMLVEPEIVTNIIIHTPSIYSV
jgi:hypothetical protein